MQYLEAAGWPPNHVSAESASIDMEAESPGRASNAGMRSEEQVSPAGFGYVRARLRQARPVGFEPITRFGVLQIDIHNHEPVACWHANIGTRPPRPPFTNSCMIVGGIFEPVVRQRSLVNATTRHDGNALAREHQGMPLHR
jgi:hypothetical protein